MVVCDNLAEKLISSVHKESWALLHQVVEGFVRLQAKVTYQTDLVINFVAKVEK